MNYYWILLVLTFITSVPAMAQKDNNFPLDVKQKPAPSTDKTNKQAEKNLQTEAKREKKEREKHEKVTKKLERKAQKSTGKEEHQGIIRKRKKTKAK